jgi:hypothetical protein
MKTYTKDELNAMLSSNKPEDRKTITELMKHYGKPVSEIVAMKPEDRVKFILEKQQPKAAPKAAAGKTAATAKTATKTAAKKAAEPVEDEEEEAAEEAEAEEEAAEEAPAASGGGVSEELVAALQEQVGSLKSQVEELEKVALESHMLLRILVKLNGIEDGDLSEFVEPFYGQLVVNTEGNG